MKKKPLIILFFCSLSTLLIIQYSLYFNIRTDSMPIGIYRRVNDKPKIGAFAASCLTQEIADYGLARGYLMKGNCPTGIQPVLKKVYAVEGDYISMEDGYIAINGETLYELPVAVQDSKGRQVKQFMREDHYLTDGEYLLLSDHKVNSWDSRYWGEVPMYFTLEPFFIFD